MPLKTDYTNDILNTDINVERKYVIKDNNGSVVVDNATIEDVTAYTREGSRFGANDINATNTAVNELNDRLNGQRVKLWENPNGLLGAGKISLDLSKFDCVQIEYTFAGEKYDSTSFTQISTYPIGRTVLLSIFNIEDHGDVIHSINAVTREARIDTDGIAFQLATMMWNGGLYLNWDARCVPKKIYGIKY